MERSQRSSTPTTPMLRFRSIESLRGWMAWWVVVGHALHLTGFSSDAFDGATAILLKLLTSGETAVNVFIVVSGFVICHLLQSRPEPYGPYILRRFLRIFPIFLFCLVVSILLMPLYREAYGQEWVHGIDWRQERMALQESDFALHLGLHLTMLHGLVPDSVVPFSSSTFLAPAWSLSLEWQFYLLAPLLLALLTRNPFIAVATGVAMLASHLFVETGVLGLWRYPSFLPISFQYFLMGIACRFLLETTTLRSGWMFGLLLALSVLLADWKVLVIWFFFYWIILTESARLPAPQGVLAKIVAILALNPVLYRLGTWSFSTYLIHIPVFTLVVGSFHILAPATFSQEVSRSLIVIGIVLTLPISWLLYTWVEHPFIRLGHKLMKRPA